ncbi:phosphotransferase family [Fusarium beomiforme]|uniref:Phosphotransferase family n=1 Tax=Fusarium beomiforme TaxID=44412 RepID=A0A9P5ADV9_9HYPO|nr:phosphotransferase family [Fusarium beomiforme]
MSSTLSPDQLPQGPSVIFYDSSFFKRGPERLALPTPCEVLARPNFVKSPHAPDMKLRQPAKFEELGLVVKHSDNPDAIIQEGQCLWAVRHLLPEVPAPEIYGWTQENGVAFLYMEYIDGATLRDHWDSLVVTEKDGVCEQLKAIITKMSYLYQASNRFIGSINHGPLGDAIFTDKHLSPAGPFSSVTEFHNFMSDTFKWPAKVHQPDLDPANIPDPYREMLPDDCSIQFTHGDLKPVNIMVSKDSPCRILAILDWEQSGWYPDYWEFCKAEFTLEPGSEWQTVYLHKVLEQPDCIDAFYSYTNAYGP